jgi:hypothetical protein
MTFADTSAAYGGPYTILTTPTTTTLTVSATVSGTLTAPGSMYGQGGSNTIGTQNEYQALSSDLHFTAWQNINNQTFVVNPVTPADDAWTWATDTTTVPT